MIRPVVAIILLVFTVGAIVTFAAPVYEDVGTIVSNDDAVQQEGHDSTVDDIITSMLVYAPLVLILGFMGWGFVWILRRERTFRRVR